jgi:hypothetical protein
MEHTHDHLHRLHARHASPDPLAEAEAQLVSIVYYTAPKTFPGPVGGYSTVGHSDAITTTSQADASTTPASNPDAQLSSDSIVADTSTHAKSKSSSIVADTTLRTSSTGLPASIVPTSSVATSLAIAVATSSSLSTTGSSATLSRTASAASSTSSASSSPGGMSAGGKIGLAVGILLLFGTVLALVLFCFRKRKDAMKAERLDDEKTEMFAGAGRTASTRTTATAPRLSLRPITQFLPNLGEKRQSRGNVLAMASPISQPSEPRKTASAWERPMLSQDLNRNNPFGNHAETIDATNANGPSVVDSVGPGGEIISAAAAAPVASAAAIGLARGASKRENQPKQIDFTKSPFRGPPSPAGTEFSMTSDFAGTATQTPQGAAIAAAGGPANSAVHRVQLDFKPSMDDELELRAGQLIRMLHEYDDGWVSRLASFCRLYCLLTFLRHSAFVLTALNKVWFLEHVSLLAPSSPVLSKTVLEAHHHQACAFLNKAVQCHPL